MKIKQIYLEERAKLMRQPFMLIGALILLGCGCSGDQKKDTRTAKDFLKEEKAKQTDTSLKKANNSQEPQKIESTTTPKQPEKKEAKEETEKTLVAPPSPASTEPAPVVDVPPPVEILNMARSLVRQGQYEQAINQCRAALRRSEKYSPAMLVMALSYYHLGKTEFAEAICDIALNIKSDIGECYNLKGFVALKNNDAPLALNHFKKATEVEPSFGPAWLNLGAEYLKVKNYELAVASLEKATSLMPNRSEAHLNLGSAYRGAGKVVEANSSYKQALQLKNNAYPSAYFNLGILYLDAPSFPGMDLIQQFGISISNFNKYKQLSNFRSKDDPVDEYIKSATKAIQREQRRIATEQQRAARAAAKKASATADTVKTDETKKPPESKTDNTSP